MYLAGASLARRRGDRLSQRRAGRGLALVLVVGWGLAGITVLPREDVGGALGAALLADLSRARLGPHTSTRASSSSSPALELYGTAIGTWDVGARHPRHRGLERQPAERRRSGYIWFDIVALALAPRLLAAWSRIQPSNRLLLGLGRE